MGTTRPSNLAESASPITLGGEGGPLSTIVTFEIHRFTAASDLAAEVRAETKGQPPIPFGIGGLVRADLTLPRSPGQSSNVGNIGHGGNGRCQATAGPQRQSATAGNGNGATAGQRNVGNGNGESRRYQRNRNGQGCLPCPCESQRIALASRLTAITLVSGACAIAERKRIRPTP